MAVPRLVGADGRHALPVFTSYDALRAWRADARPVPMPGEQAIAAAIAEGYDAVVLDVAGPIPHVIELRCDRRELSRAACYACDARDRLDDALCDGHRASGVRLPPDRRTRVDGSSSPRRRRSAGGRWWRCRPGLACMSCGAFAREGAAGTDRRRTTGGPISVEPRINDRIRVPEVRLVGPNGEQVGIVAIGDALRLAQEADLDLVEVAPDARPPVCKLMDYGKWKYENAQKAREARRNQSHTVIKEMKLRPKIDPHDYETKKGHVVRFLKAGDKVKITIMFRGREQSRPELGFRLLQRLAGDVEELGYVEAAPKQDGRNMIMVMAPHRGTAAAVASPPVGADAPRQRPPSRRPRRPRSRTSADAEPAATARPQRPRRRGSDAQDEDAQRSEEALPGDRHRQAHAPPRGPPVPPARAQAVDPDPPAGQRAGPVAGRHQEGQQAARPR